MVPQAICTIYTGLVNLWVDKPVDSYGDTRALENDFRPVALRRDDERLGPLYGK